RPELEFLEDRLVRGETFFGALVAHVWLEPNLLAAADDGTASPGRPLQVLATARPLAAAPWFQPAAAEQTSAPAVAGRPVMGASQDQPDSRPEDDGTALGSFPFPTYSGAAHGASGLGGAIPSSALLAKGFYDQNTGQEWETFFQDAVANRVLVE